MKKINWIMLAVFACTAPGLRIWQLRTGFDEEGLPLRGNLPGLLLPLTLFAAVVYFSIAARGLPKKCGDSEMKTCFSFKNSIVPVLAVSGAFLTLGAAAAIFAGYTRGTQMRPLIPLTAAAGLCLLYVIFSLVREQSVQGLALLAPLCALVVYLIFLYRADASNPLLTHIYVELLAVASLILGTLQLAAFAFADGTPRRFLPASALSVILSLAAIPDQWMLVRTAQPPYATTLLFASGALLELSFLAAAHFDAVQDHEPQNTDK